MRKNVTAVIRGFGERTKEMCHYLLTKELPRENIFVVHKSPSTEGTRAVYNIGLEENRKWTLFIDADLLLLPGSVGYLYELAESQAIPAFGVKGTVKDRVFMEERGKGCGPIMYYTEAFNQALSFIPDPYERIRPDSYIISMMKKYHSYEWVRESQCLAFHDYEQFYFDLYKKMVVNSRKMVHKCNKLLDRWHILAETDPDFATVLEGYEAGQTYAEPLAIDYTKSYGYQGTRREKENIVNFEETMARLCSDL